MSLQNTSSLSAFQREVCDALRNATGTKTPQKDFFPHISLYYGEIPTKERHRIASSIRAKGVSSDEDGTSIDGKGDCLPAEIWMVKTEGKVEDWKVLDVIKLEN